jgi:hypothetical protein
MKKIIAYSCFAVLVLLFLMVSCSTPSSPGVSTPLPQATPSSHSATPTFTIIPTATAYLKGSSWTQSTAAAAFQPRTQFVSLVFNNLMWIIGGSDISTRFNDSYSSSDGATWVPVNTNCVFSGRYGHTGQVFTNFTGPLPGTEKMWIMGGYNGSYLSDVWYSTNGYTWVSTTASAGFGSRADGSSVVHNGLLWIIAGGTTGNIKQKDVYNSADGITWTQVTSNAAFGKRKQHTSVEFNNLMWVIGGVNDTSALLNDVWYSSNGIDWICATGNAGFTPRANHTSVVYDNKIWVLGGGISGGTTKNDCWYSSDGVTWKQAAVVSPFDIRAFHLSVVYNNKMWVIGGINSSYLNNVWWSQ